VIPVTTLNDDLNLSELFYSTKHTMPTSCTLLKHGENKQNLFLEKLKHNKSEYNIWFVYFVNTGNAAQSDINAHGLALCIIEINSIFMKGD